MNFLLIRPNDHQSEEKKLALSPTYPPLGLLYIAAALEKNGHKVKIIDYNQESFSKETLANNLNNVDVVGLSVYNANLECAKYISKTIKEIKPEIPIIIGGPYCIFHKMKTLEHIQDSDIVISGEGEEVIINLVKYFQGKKKLSEIPGIFYKEKNQIKNGQPLRVIKNIDKILFPARHLVEKYDYGKINGSFFFKHRFTTMLTSRGCPSRCRFCARYGNIIEGWGSRMRSTENILAEFKEISKRYNSVMIVDDNFLISKNRAHNIMDEIIKQVLDFEIYIQGARVDTAEKELYKKMKKAGVRLIEFGIESGNQDVLEFYNKKTTVDDIKKAVNLSSKTGFITFGTFIFGAPFETQKHIENTIDFACSLPLDIAVFYPLHYTMGSDLWNEAVKNKKIRQEEYIVTSDKKRGLGNFSADELENFTRYATKRFYQRPKFYFQQFYKTIIRKDMRLLRTGLKFIKN